MFTDTRLARYEGEPTDEDDLDVLKIWFSQYCPNNGADDAVGHYGRVYSLEDSECLLAQSGTVDRTGSMTNYRTAYLTLNEGLRWLSEEYTGVPVKVEIYGDLKTMVHQVRGDSSVNDSELLEFRRETRQLLDQFQAWEIHWENDSEEIKWASQLAKQEMAADQAGGNDG